MTKKALHILAEYAPGIPSKVIKELPRISEPQPMQLAIQKHDAKRAGTHYDVRIVDEKSGKAYSWAVRNLPTNPGDKTLAVLQPTHTAGYSTWSGIIESGYGAGEVNLFSHDKIEVIKAEPSKITFNVYKTNGDTERYAMINTSGDDWLFHNVTPTRQTRPELPTEKPKYKSEPIGQLDPTRENEVWAPKVDGALNVFLLRPDKPIETYSYRPSAKGAHKLIDHTYRLGLHRTIVPTAFKGKTIVLGEVFAKDRSTGKVLSSTDTTSRLLSNVWRSRELQENAPLDNMVFNVLRYNGRDVSKKPYSEKLKILRNITSAIPELKLPPLHSTPDSKAALLKDIREKNHPLTEEGIVVYNTDSDTPVKAKVQQDYDVVVRGVFPGEKKYKGKAAGGFTYSFNPTGPITGRVGSGLTDAMRKELWERPDTYVGSVARIFAQQQLPSGALRMPVFKDMRSELWKNAGLPHGLIRRVERAFKPITAAEHDALETAAILGKGEITKELDNKVVQMAIPHQGTVHHIRFDTVRKKMVTHLRQEENTFPMMEQARVGRLRKTGAYTPSKLYAQYMSRDDNGKRKYTWIAHNKRPMFDAAYKHVTENGYVAETPVLTMIKRAEPVTGYPISTTNLHEIGKTQGEEMPDPNIEKVRRFLRKKAALFMTETAGANQVYTDTSAERIMENDADNPASISAAKRPIKRGKKQSS